jgi:hypothetical protein
MTIRACRVLAEWIHWVGVIVGGKVGRVIMSGEPHLSVRCAGALSLCMPPYYEALAANIHDMVHWR